MGKTKLEAVILDLKQRLKKVEEQDIKLGETDTRQGLINPLFQACGWDFSDFSTVKSEFRFGAYNDPVDYAFFSSKNNKQPVLLLEAKSLGTNLSSPKIIKQLCTYLGEMGVQWGVLSDGNKYVMYNSRGGVSFDDQRFITLQIKTVDTDDGLPVGELAEKLWALLGRDCLENDNVQKTYEDHMISQQIEDAFISLMSRPFDTLAGAIRREFKEDRVRSLPDLKITSARIIQYLEDICDEEGRLPIDLDQNEVSGSDDNLLENISNSDVSSETLLPPTSGRTKLITISDLLEDGIAHEGDNWKAEYKGEAFWGRITGNGEIEINGNLFGNPSKAGTSIIQRPCGGWGFWKFKDNDGEWRRVEELRKQFRENHGLTAVRRTKKAAVAKVEAA